MSMSPPKLTEENMNVWRNDSQIRRPIMKTVVNSAVVLVCIFGLAGNGIVAFFLGFRIKRNKFTVYILNLAMADILFLLFTSICMVCIIVFNVKPDTMEQRLDMDNINKAIGTFLQMGVFGYNAGLYLLTAISVERCLSVVFPIWYQCRRPKHQSAVVCGFLWMLSCLANSMEFFACDRMQYLSQERVFSTKYSDSCPIVFDSIGFLNFLVFTPIMVLSSVILLIKVKRNSWKRQPSKLYKVILFTVAFFLIFAIPIRVTFQIEYKYKLLLPTVVMDVSSLLCSINSSVNPFIYWFVGRRGGEKGSFKMILQKIFREDLKLKKEAQSIEMADNTCKETGTENEKVIRKLDE